MMDLATGDWPQGVAVGAFQLDSADCKKKRGSTISHSETAPGEAIRGLESLGRIAVVIVVHAHD